MKQYLITLIALPSNRIVGKFGPYVSMYDAMEEADNVSLGGKGTYVIEEITNHTYEQEEALSLIGENTNG